MEFFVSSLVGAVIGYITNWLAIKMLFKPHKELRIGKLKVPFTPGLIPKEKSRIAKSVGEAVGQHLLTKETIIQSLCSENINQQLDIWAQKKVNEIKNSSATIENWVKPFLKDEYDNYIENINTTISDSIIKYLNREEVKRAVYEYTSQQIMNGLSIKVEDAVQSSLYRSIREKMLDMIIRYKDSEKFSSEVKKIAEEKIYELKDVDKSLGEIIPADITNGIKAYVYEKRHDIASGIKWFMHQESVKQKVKQIISNTISTQLNPMIALFINSDKIYEKVLIGLYDFLGYEKNHDDIASAINSIIDQLLESRVSTLIKDLPKEETDESVKALIDLFMQKIIDQQFITNIFTKIETGFSSYTYVEEMINRAGIDYKSTLVEFLKERIETMFCSHSFKQKIKEAVSVMLDNVLHTQVKYIFKEPGDKLSSSISKMVRELYNELIKNKAAGVIEFLNISKIVEDRINEFDVDFAEQIILEIASRELKAITWLGALLGAIMGLLSPVLGSF